MSLILEALKKSEAERRLGQAPGLATPMRHARSRDRSGRWLALAATGLVAALAVAYSLLGPRAVDPVPVTVTPQTSAKPAQSNDASSASSVKEDAGTQQTGDPRADAALPDPPSASRRESPQPDPARASAAQARAELPKDPVFESIEREALAMIAPADDIDDASRPAPQSLDVSAEPAGPQTASGVRSLDTLDAATRSSLPPLKMSMHVFVEQAGSRVVRIDGRRLVEGDMITPSLRLHEIRRDGVILELDAERYLLARP